MGKLNDSLKKLGKGLTGNDIVANKLGAIIEETAEGVDGYLANKDYVNSLMSGALKRVIVEELPQEDIDTNTIYMVLDSQSEQEGNVYNEYMYIENAWELIGTTAVSGGGEQLIPVLDINGNTSINDLLGLLNIDPQNPPAATYYYFTPKTSFNEQYGNKKFVSGLTYQLRINKAYNGSSYYVDKVYIMPMAIDNSWHVAEYTYQNLTATVFNATSTDTHFLTPTTNGLDTSKTYKLQAYYYQGNWGVRWVEEQA